MVTILLQTAPTSLMTSLHIDHLTIWF